VCFMVVRVGDLIWIHTLPACVYLISSNQRWHGTAARCVVVRGRFDLKSTPGLHALAQLQP
jgi:hypothetical protein